MTEAATVEYEKALAIVGEREPFVAGKLSRAYLELGRHERAIELAGPLAEADEADAAPATTLGLAHLAAGNADSARDALERALRITPFDPAVRCGLAEAYSTLGESSKKAREQAACERLRR